MTASYVSFVAAVMSLALLVLNDRIFKQHPTWLTGKLSDVTGLFLVPYPLVGFFVFVQNRSRMWATLFHPLLGSTWVGLVFIWAKTSQVGADTLEKWWPWPTSWNDIQIVRDPTDLIALPFLGLGYAAAKAFWKKPTSNASATNKEQR